MNLRNVAFTKIRVDASIRHPSKSGRKRISQTLVPEFAVTNEKGEKEFLRFKDERGNPVSLVIGREGIEFDITNPTQKRNYEVLKARVASDVELRKIITIHDENLDIEKNIKESDLKIEVLMKLKALKDDGNSEMLRNLYRRKNGTVNGLTDAVIYKHLISYAESDASEIQDLLVDEDADIKHLIDKAVEAGLLKVENGFYMNSAGTGLAESESQMVFNIKKDPEFQATLQRSVTQYFSEMKRTTPMSLAEVQELKSNIDPAISDALIHKEEKPEDDDPSKSNVGENKSKYTEKHILAAVTAATTNGYIEKKGQVYTIPQRNGEFNRKQLNDYYLNPENFKEAEFLIEKMSIEAGLKI